MRIGIIGTGNMADALGTQWARAGHEVMVGGRDPVKAAATARKIGGVAGTMDEAAGFGEVVLLAVSWAGVAEVLAAVDLRGRVVIDCVNPIPDERLLLATEGVSVAEQVAAVGARVVKAFNLCHMDVWRMTPPVFDGRPLAVPLCGDDPGALAAVRTLVTDLGCTPVDGGGLERAGLLEATAAFMIGLWFTGADAQAVVPPLAYAFG